MAHRSTVYAVLIASLFAGSSPSAAQSAAGKRRKARLPQTEDDAPLRDSLAPLPETPAYSGLPAKAGLPEPAPVEPMSARAPAPAKGPWIGRYDLTTSDPMGDVPENDYIGSMVDTGKRKAGLVNIGDGLGRIVLTPIVTASRATGPKDALKRLAFCPFICAIGAVTGVGQVTYGVLTTVTADIWHLFRKKA
jgi:hypothetical protein